jgi:putative transposase
MSCNHYIPLCPGKEYHLLSKANGNDNIFRQPTDFLTFQARLADFILPIAQINSYTLLPNHFHLIVAIREEEAIKKHYTEKKRKKFSRAKAPDFIMERFANLLNSYCKTFNWKYNRLGSLFIDYLRRAEIKTEEEFRTVSAYIHHNAFLHQFSHSLESWPWSSYPEIISGRNDLVNAQVLDRFGGIENFIQFHNMHVELNDLEMELLPVHQQKLHKRRKATLTS